MYKLTIVAGPNRGTSYALQVGQTSIGRQSGNGIVLQSSKVSKRHCVLVYDRNRVELQDQNSANGTFVNGVLTRSKELHEGDQISVGEYVFELKNPVQRGLVDAPALRGGMGQVIQFPGAGNSASGTVHAEDGFSSDHVPSDLKGKAIYTFEKFVMPFFYGLSMKHDWKVLFAGLFFALVAANVITAVFPLLESNTKNVLNETSRRALFMAKQITERNSPALTAKAENRTEIGAIEREDGVQLAVLTDLENRIIAPPAKLGQYLMDGLEANFAKRASIEYRKGYEKSLTAALGDRMVVAVDPVKVYDASVGKNVVIAMSVVSIDAGLYNPDLGSIGVVYSETLVLTGLIALFFFGVIYRLTLKPYEVMNDDVDRILKGQMTQVTHEFKNERLNSLWEVLNAAMQRVSLSSNDGQAAMTQVNVIEEMMSSFQMVGGMIKAGILILTHERKIAYLNPIFEEISGIRLQNAIAQDVNSVARDQAFTALVSDVADRVQSGSLVEDFEFSGVAYKVHASGVGTLENRGYILVFDRAEES